MSDAAHLHQRATLVNLIYFGLCAHGPDLHDWPRDRLDALDGAMAGLRGETPPVTPPDSGRREPKENVLVFVRHAILSWAEGSPTTVEAWERLADHITTFVYERRTLPRYDRAALAASAPVAPPELRCPACGGTPLACECCTTAPVYPAPPEPMDAGTAGGRCIFYSCTGTLHRVERCDKCGRLYPTPAGGTREPTEREVRLAHVRYEQAFYAHRKARPIARDPDAELAGLRAALAERGAGTAEREP